VSFENEHIITQDPQFHKILKLLRQIAHYGSTVILIGDSGTGKDLLAHYIHQLSPRKSKPFVKIDCAAIPHELAESEIFGHEKGSFTGAVQQRIGKFELAHTGTVFLDQVGDLPLSAQSKLTRVLQERRFERVGGNETLQVDVQIISASRSKLDRKLREGLFREDLYFRLSVMPINLPLLRARKGDIPLLIKNFLEKFAKKYDRPVPRLSPNVLDQLCSYHWPGNVRELENLMERLIISHTGESEITPSQIQLDFDRFDEQTLDRLAEQSMSIEEVEKLYIQKILRRTKGNKSKAAIILGINRKTLLEKRKKYNLD